MVPQLVPQLGTVCIFWGDKEGEKAKMAETTLALDINTCVRTPLSIKVNKKRHDNSICRVPREGTGLQCSDSLAICSARNWTLVVQLDYLLLGQSDVAPSLAIAPHVLLTTQSIDRAPVRSFVMTGGRRRECGRCRRWVG